jgi:hypothetical protein
MSTGGGGPHGWPEPTPAKEPEKKEPEREQPEPKKEEPEKKKDD